MSSQTRSLDDPNIDSIVNKYYVKSSKLEKSQNPHYTSVDSLINEKTRSILTNLDNKLSSKSTQFKISFFSTILAFV